MPTVNCSRMDEADTAASPAGPKLAPLLLPAEATPGLDAPVDAAGLGVPTPTSRGKTPTRKWTTEEDALLQNAVRDHDGKCSYFFRFPVYFPPLCPSLPAPSFPFPFPPPPPFPFPFPFPRHPPPPPPLRG